MEEQFTQIATILQKLYEQNEQIHRKHSEWREADLQRIAREDEEARAHRQKMWERDDAWITEQRQRHDEDLARIVPIDLLHQEKLELEKQLIGMRMKLDQRLLDLYKRVERE